MKIERVFHHHDHCEENKAGMWRSVSGVDKESYIQRSAGLMRDQKKFKYAMQCALVQWPNSCEANLSAEPINRQAWMGHAGCCIATGSPEETTRLGWHRLTSEQQAIANRMADEVIEEWEMQHKDKQRASRARARSRSAT